MSHTTEQAFSLQELRGFIGSTQFFRQPASKLVYTEGVQFVAERANAYWLLCDIAFQHLPDVRRLHPDWFYLLKLTVPGDNTAKLCIEDGNGRVLYRHMYEFSDFPVLAEPLKLYACEWPDDDYCLMLPSEY